MRLQSGKQNPVPAAMALSLLLAVAACGGENAADEASQSDAGASQNASAGSQDAAADMNGAEAAAMNAAQEALSSAEEEAPDAMEGPQPEAEETDEKAAALETPRATAAKIANVTADGLALQGGVVQAVLMDGSDAARIIKASAQETGEAAPAAAPSGDAAAGKRVFVKCMACHTVQEGQHRVGPSLYGIIGKTAGSVEGFRNYSPANKNSGVTWTPDVLSEYLINPQAFMPGTRMIFAGLPSEKERADLIAYLQSASE